MHTNVWNSSERVVEMCTSDTLSLTLTCYVEYATLTGLLYYRMFALKN